MMLPDGVTQYAGIVEGCDSDGFGETVCIDCGIVSERRLPERFPHICAFCLFPSKSDDEQSMRDRPRVPWSDLLEELHAAVIRRHSDFYKPFGREAKGERFRGTRDHT